MIRIRFGQRLAYRKSVASLAFIACASCATDQGPVATLPNGWSVTPAGDLVKLQGDMPLRIAAAPDGRSVLVVTGGYHDRALDVVDIAAPGVRQHVPLGKAWAGLAVGRGNETIYVSGGGPPAENYVQPDSPGQDPALRQSLATQVLRLSWRSGDAIAPVPGLAIPGLADAGRFVGGLAVDGRGRLFVANLQNDTIYAIDAATGTLRGSAKVGYRPFQLALSPDGATLAVANWGDRSVSLLSANDLKSIARIEVGMHPTDLTYGPDNRLFVANAGANSVSVVQDGRVAETIMTSLGPDDPVGSTPNALAVSRDGTRLYVANADNNDVAVIDISAAGRSSVLGFIPTGWYPSALALSPDGKSLVVGVAKGAASRPNYPAALERTGNNTVTPNPNPALPLDYIGRVMTGYAEIIPIPTSEQLAAYTRRVAANFPQVEPATTAADQAQARAAFRNIKHVLYIIRENRTYDQVLGDDARGNGDPKLTFFGRDITPNAHRLAEEMPLLDRYFVNGEVSEDGHQWADAAYATAFTERATASTYGGRGEPDADHRLTASPAGYLWDAARRRGLSYFSYGEAADFKSSPDTPPIFTGDRGLEGHASPRWGVLVKQFWSDQRQARDVERAAIFIDDLKHAERSGNWPDFIVMSLPEDHTAALKPGQPTPQAAVASNDLALGQIVEAVTHSQFWSSTAIFVTEDDAQNGPDHVDCHRSVGLVISPYVKPGFVDHTHYTMESMVRTMELILDLPPMTQYDRGATPLYRLFQGEPRSWTYSALPEAVDLNALNPPTGPLADASSKLDLSAADRADPDALNAILWAAFRPGTSSPPPTRAFVHEW